jgi:hypothetical protein
VHRTEFPDDEDDRSAAHISTVMPIYTGVLDSPALVLMGVGNAPFGQEWEQLKAPQRRQRYL